VHDASVIWKENREHRGIERSDRALKEVRYEGTVYTVDREVEMTDDAFREFGNDFLKDQPWVQKTDGGNNDKGEYRCIRVINVDTGERLLLSSEGFDYPRYIGIEPDDQD
jgi:hypothetical protein